MWAIRSRPTERLSRRFPDGITCYSMVDATTSIEAGVKDICYAHYRSDSGDRHHLPLPAGLACDAHPVAGDSGVDHRAFALFPLLRGFSINIISLLGMVLAIGLVVDDAIVVVEAVQVNIEKGLSAKQATVEAMHSVSVAIVATTVVLLAVFIPVSFMGITVAVPAVLDLDRLFGLASLRSMPSPFRLRCARCCSSRARR